MKQLRTGITVFIFMFLVIPHVFTKKKSDEWKPETNEEKIQRLSNKGEYDRALVVAKKVLKAAEQKVGPDHEDIAPILETLAEIYFHQEQYFKVERPLKRSLAIKEKALEPDHLEIAITQNKLAEIYKTLGQYSKAEQLYLGIVATSEKELGTDDPLFASNLNNLAELYSAQGKFDQAEELFKRALEILEITLDDLSYMIRTPLAPENFDSLMECAEAYADAYVKTYPFFICQDNLAELYRTQGKYDQAEPLYNRSVKIRQLALYTNHDDRFLRQIVLHESKWDMAQSLNNLAGLYSDQKKYDEAKILYNRALEIIKPSNWSKIRPQLQGELQLEVLWVTSSALALVQNDLANLYRAEGNYKKAKSLYKKALAMGKKALGPDHPQVAKTLNNMAELYRIQGKNKQAERSFKRALAINEKTLGSEHPEVASSLENIVLQYRATERKEEADKLEQRATRIRAIQR